MGGTPACTSLSLNETGTISWNHLIKHMPGKCCQALILPCEGNRQQTYLWVTPGTIPLSKHVITYWHGMGFRQTKKAKRYCAQLEFCKLEDIGKQNITSSPH